MYKIASLRRGVCSYKDMAVIARTAYNTRELEESLAARGIPYTVEGGSSFFSRPELEAPLALLALCAKPQVNAIRYDDGRFIHGVCAYAQHAFICLCDSGF